MKKYLRIMIVCNVSGSVAMATPNHSTDGTYTRSGNIKRALGIGLQTRPPLIPISPRYIFQLELTNHSCIVIHRLLVLDGSLHYVQCVSYAAILQIFLLFSMIWYCRFKLPAVSKQRDVRWCGFRLSIPLSIEYVSNSSIGRLPRLIRAHIAYEIDTAKTIVAFCRISNSLHDLIRLNSISCHVQTTKCTMMWFSMIDSDNNWLCLKWVYS